MITIVIPCLNEEETIEKALKETLREFGNKAQIMVIDNNSSDKSPEIIRSMASLHPNIEYYFYALKGKTDAILSIRHLIKYKTVILHDADLEYDIKDIKNLYYLHFETCSYMTVGIRPKKLIRSHIANCIIKCILTCRFYLSASDILTGARVIQRELLFLCESKSFCLETELTKIALKNDLKITEGTCGYIPRIKGKKIKAYHLLSIMKAALC